MWPSQPMTRKELRLIMSWFNCLTDCTINNYFSMYKVINPNDESLSMSTFRMMISESLVKPFLNIKIEKQTLPRLPQSK